MLGAPMRAALAIAWCWLAHSADWKYTPRRWIFGTFTGKCHRCGREWEAFDP